MPNKELKDQPGLNQLDQLGLLAGDIDRQMAAVAEKLIPEARVSDNWTEVEETLKGVLDTLRNMKEGVMAIDFSSLQDTD